MGSHIIGIPEVNLVVEVFLGLDSSKGLVLGNPKISGTTPYHPVRRSGYRQIRTEIPPQPSSACHRRSTVRQPGTGNHVVLRLWRTFAAQVCRRGPSQRGLWRWRRATPPVVRIKTWRRGVQLLLRFVYTDSCQRWRRKMSGRIYLSRQMVQSAEAADVRGEVVQYVAWAVIEIYTGWSAPLRRAKESVLQFSRLAGEPGVVIANNGFPNIWQELPFSYGRLVPLAPPPQVMPCVVFCVFWIVVCGFSESSLFRCYLSSF